ncbi:hypothetical protein LXL04_003511 [Taraxacum kok-saghyz]
MFDARFINCHLALIRMQKESWNVVLVHGEKPKMDLLKAKIKSELGIDCFDPANTETVSFPSTRFEKSDASNAFIRSSLTPNFKFPKDEITDMPSLHVHDERVSEGILTRVDGKKLKVIHQDEVVTMVGGVKTEVEFCYCFGLKLCNLKSIRVFDSDDDGLIGALNLKLSDEFGDLGLRVCLEKGCVWPIKYRELITLFPSHLWKFQDAGDVNGDNCAVTQATAGGRRITIGGRWQADYARSSSGPCFGTAWSVYAGARDCSATTGGEASRLGLLETSCCPRHDMEPRLRSGFGGFCAVHAVLVWLEYSRRSRRLHEEETTGGSESNYNDSEDDDGRIGAFLTSNSISYTKRCENLNTMVSFVWWLIGFYWMVSGGEILLHNAPRLYWLTVVFLAFDVFFAIFCVVLACLIGIALCCCLPCIIAILYAVAGQEGASEADLNILPKYKFQLSNNDENKPDIGAGRMIPVVSNVGHMAVERVLLPEDADCCICLSQYEDGAELHSLPCNHHFHATCIVKWLKMNATCPLCKYNILKGNEQV